jgi:hypothetical protein
MRKTLLIVGTLLALTPGAAHATGINLYWNDCSPAAGGVGVSDRANACTSNTPSLILVPSLNPAAGIDSCVGAEIVIDIQTMAATLSPWWQMGSGGCRSGTVTALGSFSGFVSGACADPWTNQGLAAAVYDPVPPNRARLRAAVAVDASYAGPLQPGVEYYTCLIQISRAKSTGVGSCAGCLDAACLVLNSVRIAQTPRDPNGDQTYTAPDQSQIATYRGGQLCATPTRNRTWGGIKALYR